MANKNELMVVENFELAISGEIADIMAEELDGLGEIPFDRVKIPSGGGVAFEIPGDDPDSPDLAKELFGIVIDHHPVNAYWENKYDGQNTPPSCSSMDGKTGIEPETGEMHNCQNCPYNEFGSDGEGKKCKNMHRLYILQEGSPLPFILTLPPTSIKNWKEYIGKRIVIKGYRPHHVITKITLKKETNKQGIAYSSAQFALGGKIQDSMKADIDGYKESIKKTTRKIGIIDDDYNAKTTQNATATTAADYDADDFVVTDGAPTFEEALANE